MKSTIEIAFRAMEFCSMLYLALSDGFVIGTYR